MADSNVSCACSERKKHQGICPWCKSEFSSNRKRKFCSDTCCSKSNFHGSNVKAAAKRRLAGIAPRTLRPLVEKSCLMCGDSFKRKDRKNKGDDASLYCSRDCAGRHVKEKNAIAKEQAKKDEPKSCSVFFPICIECDRAFSSTRSDRKVCSDKCRYSRGYRRNVRSKAIEVQAECQWCFDHFCYMSLKKDPIRRKYCSDKCRMAVSSHKHSLKQRCIQDRSIEGHIAPYEIYTRDRWRCRHCAVKTPRFLCGSRYHNNAPTLDHIIPISRGGMHVRSNLALLCRQCNSTKSDRLLHEIGWSLSFVRR